MPRRPVSSKLTKARYALLDRANAEESTLLYGNDYIVARNLKAMGLGDFTARGIRFQINAAGREVLRRRNDRQDKG